MGANTPLQFRWSQLGGGQVVSWHGSPSMCLMAASSSRRMVRPSPQAGPTADQPSLQTGPKDCLHQCGNKRLCRLVATPSISTLGSHTLEAGFCLYVA